MISRSRGFFVLALLAVAVRVCAGGIVRDDVVLGGPEIAAARLAIDDFIQHHYSTSGDLSHYRIRFHHERDTLEIDFIPDTDPRGPYPGGAAYGKQVLYTLSLEPAKILHSQLYQ